MDVNFRYELCYLESADMFLKLTSGGKEKLRGLMEPRQWEQLQLALQQIKAAGTFEEAVKRLKKKYESRNTVRVNENCFKIGGR